MINITHGSIQGGSKLSSLSLFKIDIINDIIAAEARSLTIGSLNYSRILSKIDS